MQMTEEAQPVNHVLLVDDDGVTLKAVEMLLRKFGWTVTTAAGGKEALKAMEASKVPGARPIDLVLTDLLMPDVDGLQLLSEAGEVPVVVMSSADSQEDVLNCLQKGAADYLIKVSICTWCRMTSASCARMLGLSASTVANIPALHVAI
jgi:DNA-binding response OmpR family regulator